MSDDDKKSKVPEYPLRSKRPQGGDVDDYPFTKKTEEAKPEPVKKPEPEPEEVEASQIVESDIAEDKTFPDPTTFGGGPAAIEDKPKEPTADDLPILPRHVDDSALFDAVGAPKKQPKQKKREERYDDDPGRAKRRMMMIVVLSIIGGLIVTSIVFFGRANAQRYLISCTTDSIAPEQGRTFPPWGSKPLAGPQWKPIALPPNAECKPRETEDLVELEKWYLDLLMDRASTTLTSKNPLEAAKSGPNPLDVAAEQLNQALLLSRAPERRDQRKEVERLLGDVQYWRATQRLRDANQALADAARQFEAASTQRPRHVTDAAAWSTFLKGVRPAMTPSEEHPSAPLGVALPTSEPPPEGSDTAPTPDAGVPTGGVLL